MIISNVCIYWKRHPKEMLPIMVFLMAPLRWVWIRDAKHLHWGGPQTSSCPCLAATQYATPGCSDGRWPMKTMQLSHEDSWGLHTSRYSSIFSTPVNRKGDSFGSATCQWVWWLPGGAWGFVGHGSKPFTQRTLDELRRMQRKNWGFHCCMPFHGMVADLWRCFCHSSQQGQWRSLVVISVLGDTEIIFG